MLPIPTVGVAARVWLLSGVISPGAIKGELHPRAARVREDPTGITMWRTAIAMSRMAGG
jgi:hypothetical protein